MKLHVVEGRGERLLAHSSGFQYLHAVRIARDTWFSGPGAQCVGNFGGSPMGMHIAHHGFCLQGPFGSLTRGPFDAKVWAELYQARGGVGGDPIKIVRAVFWPLASA